jgi:hypothetical protein
MTVGRVFVSYCVKDSQAVRDMVEYLERRGISAWIAPRDVRPGIDYSEQIQEAIEQCSAFVVAVTQGANTSLFVRAETEMAFSSRRPIFPVRFGEVAPAKGLRLFLNIHHWTNAFGPEASLNLSRLADELSALSRSAEGSTGAVPEAYLDVPTAALPGKPPGRAGMDARGGYSSGMAAHFSPLMVRRAKIAVASAMLLSMPLACVLVLDGSSSKPIPREPEGSHAAKGAIGVGTAISESSGSRSVYPEPLRPPSVQSNYAPALRGGTPEPQRRLPPLASRTASSRRLTRAAESARARSTPTATVQSQMRCRAFTVPATGSEPAHCTGPRGVILAD